MNKNQQKDTIFPKQPDSRLTIGFTSRHLKYKNSYTVWQGVIDAAREREVNVISLLARDLDTPEGFEAQANVLYDLVNTDMLDGLVVWVTRLTEYAGQARAKQVLDGYRAIPIVAVERGGPEDIPWVDADNYQAMREMMIHLVKEHGYRRIAFIRGADATHARARARYQAYLDVLAEYGLPFDPDLVSPPAEGWYKETGEVAISLLLDQRHVISFDAVVGVSDEIATGALEALQARGIQVPEQVAIVGFDDDMVSNSILPPLTTIPLQGYEMGQRAVELLVTLLEGGQTPTVVNVPPRLIIRQSCGCANPAVTQAAAEPVILKDKPLKTLRGAQRKKILSAMRQAAGDAVEKLDPGWAEQLLDAFWAELTAGKPGTFLAALNEILRRLAAADGQVFIWEHVILALRRSMLPHLGLSQMLRQAEDLWLQAQIKTSETDRIAQRGRALQAELQTEILEEIRASLITTFDIAGLMDILAQELPRLDIPGCYLSLYENPQRPTDTSRLILAYDEQRGRIEPATGKEVFPSPWLTPEGMLPQERRYSMVVEPLYFREQQLGFVLFEEGPRYGPIYDILRGGISSALQGALQVEKRKQAETIMTKRATELELVAQMGTAASTILDMTELLQSVVDLTKASFGLYHVHIYLLDEQRETLVLAAGTGEAGQQMAAEGWHIPLELEQSLVARAARLRRGSIVNDVWADPLWLPNPLLPDTRSELAVPLIVGEQVLGVLDVQAKELDYFTEDDIRIQSTLAAQVAVAIQNAQLYHQEAERARELAKLNVDLKAAQAELLRQERLATLGKLTAIVSHEIRNPLATIRASAFTIDRKTRDKEPGLGHTLDRIQRNITRCDNIIAEFLDYTRVRDLKPETVLFDDWLQQVLNEQTVPEGITLSRELNAGVEVSLDPERFRRVIINLFDNACQAMQKEPNPDRQEKILHVQSEVVEAQLKISIVDTGSGIPPDVMPHIFEPLYSTKGFGVGLGLSIVKEIVKQHGGEIELNSQLGIGTQVVVWLPLD